MKTPMFPPNLAPEVRESIENDLFVIHKYGFTGEDYLARVVRVRCICRCGWLDIADAGKGLKSEFDAYENERMWKEWQPK